MPFLPGGLDGTVVSPGVAAEEDDEDDDEEEEGWRTRPPGLKRGPEMKSRAALSEEERKEKEEQEEAVIAAFLGRTSTEGIRRPASSAAHDEKGEGVREKVEFLLKTEEERTALAARNAASGGQAISGLDDLLPLSFAVSHEPFFILPDHE